MGSMSFSDILTVAIYKLEKYGFAKISRLTGFLAIAKPVVITRHIVLISTLLLTFDVRTSTQTRISEVAVVKGVGA